MFDCHSFLRDQFGNPDSVIGLASKFDVKVPAKDTVRKWFERGAVSGEWWPVLLALLELEAGQPVGVARYLGRETNDGTIFD